ncbi:pyruvate kinase PKM-like [Rhopilema esculentum]|uniref:pyruvate kinase PKM-like n=1 Tax=Rhopilema esculentum TaxID=499914 RepID=UPI0031DFBAB8
MSGKVARFEYNEDMVARDALLNATHARNHLEFCCGLNIDTVPPVVRGTGIICTIGPACQDVDKLKEMIYSGMNIARMNFSHGTHEYHKKTIDNVREAAKVEHPHPVAIALDTKGPEIRTGIMKAGTDSETTYKKGAALRVTTDLSLREQCDENLLYVDYKGLAKSVKKGSKIFIADGLLSLEVTDVLDDHVMTKILNDAAISSRKNCNLPGAIIDLPAVSEKDVQDLQFGVENEVDMIFASFIRKAQDIRDVRKVLGEKGKDIKIIAKIENHEGIINIDEILMETDGVMVARGDMGMEIPLEKVFLAQKMIIARCNMAAKPVICATQMLESMTENPRPTRAEASDVANAVLDGVDCVMLSGETAKGAYPSQAVLTMHKICREAEAAIFHRALYDNLKNAKTLTDATETTCIASVSASFKVNAATIIAFSTSGRTARILSHYRPRCPIILITRNKRVCRQAHLSRGLFPLYYDEPRQNNWSDDVNARLVYAVTKGKDMGFIRNGSFIVFVVGWSPGSHTTNTMRILQVSESGDVIGRRNEAEIFFS